MGVNSVLAYDESKFWQYPIEEIEQYCLFDEFGSIIGVKETAPADFKKAYEEDKKRSDELEKLGIDV